MASLEVYAGCRDLVVRCLRALDARNYDDVAASFADDGVWDRAGELLVGPRAVRAALANRPADLQTQHLVSNMIVDAESDETAIVRYSLSAYVQQGEAPFHLHAIFQATDRLISSHMGWRFLNRSVSPAFEAPSTSGANEGGRR